MKNATMALVGPSQSGKTTFIRYLETGKPVEQDLNTTLGVEIRKKSVKFENWEFTTVDTGGQELYQQTFWELAIQQADVVIFMIDATIREGNENYEVMKEQFEYALDVTPRQIPILVLLNKQDLQDKNPMSPQDAFSLFMNANLQQRTIAYLPVSAKYGQGVDEALTWILENLEER